MNTYFKSVALLSAAIMFNITANNSFEKLAPGITKSAQTWANNVATSLPEDMQLAYLNFLALQVEESIPALIKCVEYIEAQQEMETSYQEFATNFIQPIKKYAENCHEKISRKKNLTEEQEETLWQKLETKIQELISYINSIYYHILYGQVATKVSAPCYMFDENGLIPAEKRTQGLPLPR
ncbi:MAG TPA: hypothetical protein VKU36_02705 [Candidatus Babeliales bacterium]|nr:hypothetical protein [Candidatus Babeliales bacterium]